MNFSTFAQMKTMDLPPGWVSLTEEQLRQLQNTVKSIAADVIQFCEEHHLRIYLGGGSALGAVRHQGFIPWDDDMDLNMPRPDFDEFLRTFPERYQEKYWIHAPENIGSQDPSYHSLMAKVILKHTVVRHYEEHASMECGACVDIFVIENAPDFPPLRWIHGCGCIALSAVLSCGRFYQDKEFLLSFLSPDSALAKTVRRKAQLGKIFSFFPLDKWVRIANNWNKRCQNQHSAYVTVPTGRKRYFGELHRRERYLRAVRLPFAEYQWPVTADYPAYLRGLYGDYMQIPPEAGREKHLLMEFHLEGDRG